MIKLAKFGAVLVLFKFFVFDLLTPRLDLTNAAQITTIICASLVALVFGIVFVLKE